MNEQLYPNYPQPYILDKENPASKKRQISYRSAQAFDLENILELKDDLPIDEWRNYTDILFQYYSREYILQENITHYHYGLKISKNGLPYEVFAPFAEYDGDVLESFKRRKGEREEAECRGFEIIEQKLFSGQGRNRFFVWISPPGRKEDGYDSHNFTFIGRWQEGNNKLDMVAYKNWLTPEKNARFLNTFLSKDQKLNEKSKDLDFLKTPVFLPGSFSNYLEVIYKLDPERKDLKIENNSWFLDKLSLFRDEIIKALEKGDVDRAIALKNGHDNFALSLLNGGAKYSKNFDYWANLPTPALRGSCGFSTSFQEIFSSPIQSSWLGIEQRYFDCPKCYKKIESGKGITTCLHCGAKKEDYKNCD